MSSTVALDAVTKSCPAGGGAESGFPAVSTSAACIEAGTTTVLLGSSDRGKTTLLHMANRMVGPSSGRVLTDDEDVAARDAVALRCFADYIMQGTGLLPCRCVINNITLVPRLQGADHHDARHRALELMGMFDLDRDLAGRCPHQLPGGQVQRVGMAWALTADPEVLPMDEPPGAVDLLVRRDLQRGMARIQAELGKTVIFVTHDVGEAFALSDEIILLCEGARVAQRGSGPQLLTDPTNDFAARFLGLDDAVRQLRPADVTESRIILDRVDRATGCLADKSSSETEERA